MNVIVNGGGGAAHANEGSRKPRANEPLFERKLYET